MAEEQDGALSARTVVGVDGSEASMLALRWAARMAAVSGAGVDAVTAWDYIPAIGWRYVPPQWDPQDAQAALAASVDAALGVGRPAGLRQLVREGNPAKVLLEQSTQAQMLVVGSRGRGGFVGMLLGSVSALCVEHASCPVLVVHDSPGLPGQHPSDDVDPTPDRIVVGVDGSEQSKQALRWAARMAATMGASVEAVLAWQMPQNYGWPLAAPDWDPDRDARGALVETVDGILGSNPSPRPNLVVQQGNAAKVLLDRSSGARMLVLGSRGRGGFAGLLLGSVSATCAKHARCPVLVVREPPPPSDL
jgi:nucleotide-binding universal stress UspA family protein